MSNRLGRNPLKTPKPVKKIEKKKTEEFGEINTKKSEAFVSASAIVQERLAEQTPQATQAKTALERLAHWLLIDVPAEGYIFGLKSILLIKTVWD